MEKVACRDILQSDNLLCVQRTPGPVFQDFRKGKNRFRERWKEVEGEQNIKNKEKVKEAENVL